MIVDKLLIVTFTIKSLVPVESVFFSEVEQTNARAVYVLSFDSLQARFGRKVIQMSLHA